MKFSGRSFAILTALALITSAVPNISGSAITANAASTDTRLLVDLNANDGRTPSYTKNSENWIVVSGATAETTIGGLSFTLSNGGSAGSGIKSGNCKLLQKSDGTSPTLTMDGVTIEDGNNGGTIKLEIKGLSAGKHSLKTWHSCYDGLATSTMSVSVNGKTTATGIKAVSRVTKDDDAGLSYSEFEVSSGQTVTVLISPEGNGTVNNAYLNAFEIDGADPFNGASKLYPKDKEKHLPIENGLSWTAGNGTVSHDVYIGTDANAVFNADNNSAEFKGNQSATSYTLDDSYSSLETYYWRVDEVSANGVTKGAVYSFVPARLSFPTAEGYGRYARGGQGGRIVEVTNLNDSGEGSLRNALEVEKGPRIVIFKVGGVIELKSRIIIPNDGGDVYVAGQTAPGQGITLIKYGLGAMGAEDIVIRDIHVRVGDANGKGTDGMGLGSCNNSIIDHCSISWGTDEGFSSRGAQNITFQHNIIAESLNQSVHYDANDRTKTEPHAFAASISGDIGSFHHNLLVHCTDRNWSLAGGMTQDGKGYQGSLDLTNNVIYNWRNRTTDGGIGRVKFVNNYYKMGPVSRDMALIVISDSALETKQKAYVSGNKMTDINGNTKLAPSQDAWSQNRATSTSQSIAETRSNDPMWESYLNVESADKAYENVLKNVGANAQGLDQWDTRYINEVKNGKYTYTGSVEGLKGIIDSQNDVGGYPNNNTFKGGTAYTDSDHDGMSDEWETAHKLDPNDASDGNLCTLSADGYTNVEMFLNELAGDTVEYNGNAISAFETIEAEDFDAQYGVMGEDCSEGGKNIGYIENGDWIKFSRVDFEDGANSFTARVSSKGGGMIELYTADPDNASPVAKFAVPSTGDWQNWQDLTVNINKISGRHALYLKFTGGEGYLLNMNNFVFGRESANLSGSLVKNLTVKDKSNIAGWNIANGFGDGSLLYGDRTVTAVAVPESLSGAEIITAACDSKNAATDIAEFTAGADITVYAAIDKRVTTAPTWLSGWEKTSDTMKSSSGIEYVLYKKAFNSGELVTLGTNGQSSGCVNYTVLVTSNGTAKIRGNVNADGEFSVADLVMMQNFLLGNGTLTDWQAGDLCEDGRIDVFDMVMMRKLLIETK